MMGIDVPAALLCMSLAICNTVIAYMLAWPVDLHLVVSLWYHMHTCVQHVFGAHVLPQSCCMGCTPA